MSSLAQTASGLRAHVRKKPAIEISRCTSTNVANKAADGTVKIWHAQNGVFDQTLESHMAGISDVSWSPDSKTLATASDDKTIRLWDLRSVCAEVGLSSSEDLLTEIL